MSELENNSLTAAVAEQAASSSGAVDQPTLEEMAKSGVLYGRKKSKTNPKMAKFIFTTRNGFEIFDLLKTLAAIEKAKAFLKTVKEKNGSVLLVGTQPAAKELIQVFAQKLNHPFVVERWLGGTITNFQTISKRINYYIKLKQDRAAGRLDKYTKKERLGFDREIGRFNLLMGGLEKMDKLPDAVIIADVGIHETAVREAIKSRIPIVGIINSNNNPEFAQYPIPANTGSKQSLAWIFNKLLE